ESYMAPNRKVLFVVYAIGSFLYRWFVTVSILFFLAKWLKPYKLETLSMMLAIGALVSLVFWPCYRLVKSVRQRGRLPDMKRKRVVTSGVILTAILVAFFFLPLPVSRVRETGMIQVNEGDREYVHVNDTGMLMEVFVHDGQDVKTGTDLARFRNAQFEFDRQKYEKERDSAADLVQAIRQRMAEPGGDPVSRSKLEAELRDAQGSLRTNSGLLEKQEDLIKRIEVLKAPRDGVVL